MIGGNASSGADHVLGAVSVSKTAGFDLRQHFSNHPIVANPGISILMPVLNQARFLRPALASVLGQSWHDLEIIVADGGSDDGTLDVLREFAARDARLKWISSPDQGAAEAVNKAALLATGDILGWLNADDIYTDAAVASAMEKFAADPTLCMVYGHGEFMDESGRATGPYPTRVPDTALEVFAEGCFICQPTAFIRRQGWQELGGLDPSLQASFDFDLWVRAFKAWPGRIGFLDRIQACSRQHGATITSTRRRVVALEALGLLRKHLDITPAHWVLNHFEEILAACPSGKGNAPRDEVMSVLEDTETLLSVTELEKARRWVESDRRVALATGEVFIGVHSDGWAGPRLEIRTSHTTGRLMLHCSNLEPCPKKMKLHISRADGSVMLRKVSGHGDFSVAIDLVPSHCGTSPAIHTVECDRHFVPLTRTEQPADPRQLCYKINHIEHIQ